MPWNLPLTIGFVAPCNKLDHCPIDPALPNICPLEPAVPESRLRSCRVVSSWLLVESPMSPLSNWALQAIKQVSNPKSATHFIFLLLQRTYRREQKANSCNGCGTVLLGNAFICRLRSYLMNDSADSKVTIFHSFEWILQKLCMTPRNNLQKDTFLISVIGNIILYDSFSKRPFFFFF